MNTNIDPERVRFREHLLSIGAGLAWAGAVVCVVLGINDDALLPIAAASMTLLAVFRRWLQQRDRLFVHGYHAGFHAGSLERCSYPDEECDVLQFAATARRD